MTQRQDPAAQAIARRVSELRRRRGWTARELAQRCSQHGAESLDRDVIANLETGRRKGITVDEWLAFARALDVAPVHLLVPVEDDEQVVVGNQAVAARQARAWLRGQEPLEGVDERTYRREAPPRERGVVLARPEDLAGLLQEFEGLLQELEPWLKEQRAGRDSEQEGG